MKKYELVRNDKNIIELYNKISKYEDETKGWAHHNLNHVNNVALLTEKLLKELNYDEDFIEEAKIAAILHDVGCLEGKDNHASRSYDYAKKYIDDNNINLNNKDLVLEAIKIHSDGFDTNNVIALVLILSDKLDIKYTRVAKEGYHIEGMRQLQYIENILINLDNNILKINFICNPKINKQELEAFYFIPKVFKAIIAFSNKMNLTPEVLFNNKKWPLFYAPIITEKKKLTKERK